MSDGTARAVELPSAGAVPGRGRAPGRRGARSGSGRRFVRCGAPIRHLILALVSCLPPAVACAAAWQQEPPQLASLVGERLDFRLRWGAIPAADAALEVVDAGPGRVLLRATARTLPYLDLLYPVRDLVESTVLVEGLRVERYRKSAREGRGPTREEEIVFDHGLGLARYRRDAELPSTLEVPAGVQDPLSCFYRYRTTPVDGDDPVELPISDGKKVINGRVQIVGREIVRTPAGRFPALIVEPDTEGLGGIFKKSPGARVRIWLTDDAWRRPVKMQSEVVIGHFTAELTRLSHPGAGPAADGVETVSD